MRAGAEREREMPLHESMQKRIWRQIQDAFSTNKCLVYFLKPGELRFLSVKL
jgi:hypothetical protein